MKAVISVIGKDKKGIIASVSNLLYKMDINIEDISQTIMQDYFTMIMLCNTKECKLSFSEIAAKLNDLEKELQVEIRIRHEDIFNSMHKLEK